MFKVNIYILKKIQEELNYSLQKNTFIIHFSLKL